MKIYDEITGAELSAPDQEKGYTYPSRRQCATELQVLPGTKGLRRAVPVYEDCLLYHTCTAEELAARQQAAQPSQLDRVEAQATYTAMMTDTLLEV